MQGCPTTGRVLNKGKGYMTEGGRQALNSITARVRPGASRHRARRVRRAKVRAFNAHWRHALAGEVDGCGRTGHGEKGVAGLAEQKHRHRVWHLCVGGTVCHASGTARGDLTPGQAAPGYLKRVRVKGARGRYIEERNEAGPQLRVEPTAGRGLPRPPVCGELARGGQRGDPEVREKSMARATQATQRGRHTQLQGA